MKMKYLWMSTDVYLGESHAFGIRTSRLTNVELALWFQAEAASPDT